MKTGVGGAAFGWALAGSRLAGSTLLACSGEAFRLDPLEVEADLDEQDAAFAELVPNAALPDAGAAPEPSGTPDSGVPLPAAPTAVDEVGPCGALRVAQDALRDDEVCVLAGTFTMGSAEPSLGAGYASHAPPHQVTLPSFVLDMYEVTVARYRRCVVDGTCPEPSNVLGQGCTYSAVPGPREHYPITCVSWDEASAFCAWDGARRLPTEAEWERATRGAGARLYPWGDTFDCDRAVLAGPTQCPEHAGIAPKPVGSSPMGRSPEGAHDLVGNAAEWVADWSGTYPNGAVTNPTGPATGSARVQRGGGWQTPPAVAVGHARRPEAPGARGAFSFRCARDPAP